jgi:predicted TIM-barrel fold metal-dependent hydrolase
VWFHTEGVRDIDQIIMRDPVDAPQQFPRFELTYNYPAALEYLALENYRYAQQIYAEFGIPFIIIGGQGPVAAGINNFDFYKHMIPSWTKQLLDMEFDPSLCTFVNWPQLEAIIAHHGLDLKRFMIDNMDEFDTVERTQQLQAASKLFPDGMHPSRNCYRDLAQVITQWTQP